VFILAVKDERGALISEHRLENAELIVGRVEDSDIVLESTAVSRQHACFFLDGEQAYVTDMASANGVYVNEQRIKRDTAITTQSRVRIADFLIMLEQLAPEDEQSPGISTAVVAQENAHGKLVILSGPNIGREVLLYEPMTSIGRIDENDVCIDDTSISRHHARLQYQDDGSYVLTDLQSSNGVYMLGRRVNRPLRIVHGDRIRFGTVECLISHATGGPSTRRHLKQYLFYGLLAATAAILGSILSLYFLRP
jgi:pSer/pThr/pTyr-binding forkhead associated (FHA) protein